MNVTLRPAPTSEQVVNLFQYYVYDMSEYTGFQPDEQGLFSVSAADFGLLDYWTEPEHFPYLIYVDDELAGFVLVRTLASETPVFDMGQFFVLRKFKGKGVGTHAFKLATQRHPGSWQTRVLPDNTGAKAFWLNVIGAHCNGDYRLSTERYKSTDMLFIRYQR